MASQEYYTLKFHHVVCKTEKAVLVSMDEAETEQTWIPLSLIEDTLDEKNCELDVPQWFADKNEWM